MQTNRRRIGSLRFAVGPAVTRDNLMQAFDPVDGHARITFGDRRN
jgi:hypothetical protein